MRCGRQAALSSVQSGLDLRSVGGLAPLPRMQRQELLPQPLGTVRVAGPPSQHAGLYYCVNLENRSLEIKLLKIGHQL